MSFAPNTWKRGTLKNLVNRLCNICSAEYLLKKELLQGIESTLGYKININTTKKTTRKKQQKQQQNDDSNTNNENSFTNENNSPMSEKQLPFLALPCKGQQFEKVLKFFKTTLYRSLPNNIETKVVYTGTKLGSIFQIKDKTKLDHKRDLVYYVKCLECQED